MLYFMNRKIIGINLFFITTLSANASLVTTTDQIIEGTRPYILFNGHKLDKTDSLLGFELPDGSWIDASMNANKITIPGGTKFSDLKLLITADGNDYPLIANETTGIHVVDSDEDTSQLNPATISGSMKAKFTNERGQVINLTNEFNSCQGPYYLDIETQNNITAQTRYGVPSDRIYSNQIVRYQLEPSPSDARCIEYLKTKDIDPTWGKTSYTPLKENDNYSSGGVVGFGTMLNSQGYNSTYFDLNKGFKVSALRGKTAGSTPIDFPKTGFANAAFSILGTLKPGESQNVYRCKTSSSNIIQTPSVGTNNVGMGCQITYTNNKFTSPITIDLEYSADNGVSWNVVDSFTLPVPTLWAKAATITNDNYKFAYNSTSPASTNLNDADTFSGLIACGLNTVTRPSDISFGLRHNYLFKRAEITNAIPANIPEKMNSSQKEGGAYTRTADGTFAGEWGYLRSYDASPWANKSGYWTSEIANKTGNIVYAVRAQGDIIARSGTYTTILSVCRG